MAHILDDDERFVGKAVSAPPISDLSRAAWGQLRDAYRLARMGDPASVRSWQRFAETDEATARLVAADVAVADDQDAAARRRVEKRLGKAEDRVYGKGKKSKARWAAPGVTKGEASVVPVPSDVGQQAVFMPRDWYAVLVEKGVVGEPGDGDEVEKLINSGGAGVDGHAGGAGVFDAEYVAYVKRAAEYGDAIAREVCMTWGWRW